MKVSLYLIFFILFVSQSLATSFNEKNISFLKNIDYSINLYDIKKNKIIIKKDINKSFIPASLTKLILTSAFLENINSKTRFKTPVYIDSSKPPNLYIIGSGDPNIKREQITKLAYKLRKKEIKEINSVILDESKIIPDVNSNATSARYYYALSGSLNSNYNQFQLLMSKTFTDLIPSPNLSYIRIDTTRTNFIKKKKLPAHPKIEIAKRKNSDKYFIVGNVTQGDFKNKNLKLRVTRPILFFYNQLEDVLNKNNITILNYYKKEKISKYKKKKIYTFISEPISTSLIKLNYESENMLGNLLFKYLGMSIYGEPGNIKKGRKAVNNFTENKLKTMGGIKINDGAGLSKYSKINSKSFNKVLIYLYKKHFALSKQFLVDVSKHKEYKNLNLPENIKVYVKSGTLAQIGVNNLAGFIENTKTKNIFSFTILTKSKEKKLNPVYKGTHTIPILNEIINTYF